DLSQYRPQCLAHGAKLLPAGRLIRGAVGAREDPQLERAARGPGGEDYRAVGLEDEAFLVARLLRDDVAPDAALLLVEPAARGAHFRSQRLGDERQRDELGVGVKEGCAGGAAMILECDQGLEADVPG